MARVTKAELEKELSLVKREVDAQQTIINSQDKEIIGLRKTLFIAGVLWLGSLIALTVLSVRP